MTYVLIWVIVVFGSVSSGAAPFSDKAACEVGQEKLRSAMNQVQTGGILISTCTAAATGKES